MSKSNDSRNRSDSDVEANTAASDLMQQQLQVEVKQRFGVLPNFFQLAPEAPEITVNLWGFASFAYLDNPLPSLFKERLFVYLSRFCDVRYCITRHLGFLIGLGFPAGDRNAPVQSIEQVINLLQRPLPRLEQIEPFIAQLQHRCESPLVELPEVDSPLEAAIFACATHAFLQTSNAPRCLVALKHVFNAATFQYLLVFLAFIRTAHYWTKVQTDLHLEDDLEHLLSTHDKLADLLMNDPETMTCETSQALMDELTSLRQEKERSDERLRVQQQLQETNEHLLHQTRTELSDRMAELQQANAELSDSRRAALNVMEDAIQSREALRESEEKYRSLFNSMDEAYAVVEVLADDNGEWNDFLFLEVNPAFVAQTGMEYPVGRKATELLGTPNPSWAKVYGRVVETGEPIRFEEGEATLGRVFDLYVFRLGEDGSRRAAVLFTDITDRKRAEAALRESEERFRLFVTASSDTVYRMSADWREMRNLEGKKILTNTEAPSQTWIDTYIPTAEQSLVYAAIEVAIRTKTPFELEHRVIREDGTIGWVFSRAIPMLNEQGDIIEWFGAGTDITARKQTEAALRESEEKYRSLFESIDRGFCLIEVLFDSTYRPFDYRFIEVNPVFEQQSNLANAVGKTILELVPNLEPQWIEFYGQVAKSGEAVRFEAAVTSMNRVFDIYAFPSGVLGEHLVAVLFADITDRKRVEANESLLAGIADDLTRLVTPDEIINAAGGRLGEALNLNLCLFVDVDEERNEVTVHHAWQLQGLPSLKQTFRIADFLTDEFARSQRNRETFIVRDTANDERTDAEAYARLSVGSILAVPFHRRGRWVAYLTVTDSSPRDWRADEIEVVREVAERVFPRIERARAEADLRESEAKYRSLFTSMDEGYILVDVIFDENDQPIDLLYLEANPAAVQMTGTELVGRRTLEIDPNFESRWFETFGRVAKTGSGERHEFYTAPLDVWYSFYVFKVGEPNETRVAAVYQDVSDRKRREANLAFFADLMKDFAPLATAEEIMEMAGKRLAEHLKLSRYMFVEIYPEAGTCTYLLPSRPAGQLEISGSFILADYHTEEEHRLLSTGHSMVMNDVRDGTRSPEQMAAFEAFDIASIVNTPYLSNGRWVFDLGVARSQPSVWREDEIELLREISARVWLRIERARAEADLRQSEAKYRSLFNSMDEGYFLCDVIFDETDQPIDLFYIDENPAAIRMTGQSFRGQRLREINPNYEEYWYEIFGRVAQTGQAERLERYAAPNQIWYDFYVFKVGSDDTRRVAVVFNDITDRKRTEAQLRRAAEIDAFRVTLSDALRPLGDPVAMQETVMQTLGAYLNVNRAFYSEVLDDDDTLVIGFGYADGLSPIVGQIKFSEFDSDLLTDYRAGRTVVINDLYGDVQLSTKAKTEFDAIQVRAAVGVALVKNEKVRAILSIHQSVPRQWTPSEIALLEETADRTWAAVERARAEAALRESEIQRVREQSVLEQERQRAESLAELDRAKTLFFSNISHEFRTPLTLLLAPVQDALSDSVNPLPGVQRERLELIHRNTMRLLKLVNTLLDFSRIEAGRMEAVYEPTDLAMFTAELASVFRSAIEQAGLRLVVDCPPMSEPVYVDREMWEKIVLNLLSNAFKFTFLGEITVRLHLTDDYHVTLQVEDTGTGIEPEEMPHLFERFYQVRKTKARTHEGSGIGLALVQELIKLHGGTVDVNSTVGQGSCFTVTISLGTAHLPSVSVAGRDRARRLQLNVSNYTIAARTLTSTALGTAPYVQEAERWILEEAGGQGAGFHVSAQPNGSRGEKLPQSPIPYILLVDDNADMCNYLTRILSEHNIEVEAIADGEAALAAATERVPDLVLSDVMMPLLDGFELLKALRADARTKEVPIILLSARAGEESIIEGLQLGADDYLIKPFRATELVTRVLAHLQLAQLRLEALHQERTISRRKDKVLSTVSHELNTPLVAILGWTRLLRSSPPNQAMLAKALETIERNATLQAKLVEDLLDISRITAGKISLNQESVQLQQVIETALATVQQSLQTKDIYLQYQLDSSPVIVQGDQERLQQIILNLLTNAVKFTPNGGRIEISLQKSDRLAQITVTDTGCGIDADFLPYIFDTFRQAPSTKKGLGLGLAIARSLVKLHGGTIAAQSPGIGKGTTFTVILPLLSPTS